MTKPKLFKIKRCVLNCQNEEKLFSFPDQADASRVWLKILGLEGTPLCRFEMYVCLNHFSSRQLLGNGRTITPTAIPDKNIPGKENPPESEIKVVQNSMKNLKSSLTSIPRPRNIPKSVMLTSESSGCYLKCKTYRSLHRFPSDLTLFNIWIAKLGLPKTAKLNRTASLCDNHFSPAMRTSKTISRCAIPDIYLPPRCKFIDEFEALSEESNEVSFNENNSTNGGLPIINYDFSHIKITDKPTNSVVSINSVDSTGKNGGKPLPSQQSDTPDIICPENNKNALFECVLKCPDSKTLYRFPNVESRRQLWLLQIGLTHCFCNTRICSRHFSEKMLSKQRLTNSAYPDINLPELEHPRIRVASLPLQDPTRLEVQEIPQYICVLTVVTNNKRINSLINKTNYVKYTVDKMIPKRERSVQVQGGDFVEKANVGILADEDFSDEEMFENNTNFKRQPDLITTMSQSQIFPSKTKDMFECLKCGEISIDKESNQRHLNLHCRDLSRLCFQCGRKFMSDIKLKIHEMKEHSLRMKKLKRCPKKNCKKAFHSRKRLDQHLDEHVRPTKHFCVNCGRLFFSSLKLSCHLLACRPVRKSRCRFKW